MYGGIKGPTPVVITGAGGAVLAHTGLPVVGLTMVAISMLLVGFMLTRAALVRRTRQLWD